MNIFMENIVNSLEDILNTVNHKDSGIRRATSKKFKIDLIDHFSTPGFKKCHIVEVGCYCGDTTVILGKLFNKVSAFDNNSERINKATEKVDNAENITFYNLDVYTQSWPIKDYEIAFIDCVHETNTVLNDINSAKKYSNRLGYIIFDDYGAHPAVKKAVDSIEWKNTVGIGHYNDIPNFGPINGYEGLICEI